MIELDRRLEELTASATRKLATPPVSAVHRRAAHRRRTRVAGALTAVAVVGAVVAVAALAPSHEAADPAVDTPITSAVATTAAPAVRTAPEATPSDVADPVQSRSKTPASSPNAGVSIVASPSALQPTFPPLDDSVQHGSRVWAVYLVISREAQDPRHAEANRQLALAGYKQYAGRTTTYGSGSLGCDGDARKNLIAAGIKLDEAVEYYASALYFTKRSDAFAFVAAFQPGVVGTVPATIYCAD